MSWPTVVVCLVWALVTWDMVRRWSFATATRTLKADLDALRARHDEDTRHLEEMLGKRAFLVDLLALRTEIDEIKAGPRLKELEQRAAHLSTLIESRRAGGVASRRLGGL